MLRRMDEGQKQIAMMLLSGQAPEIVRPSSASLSFSSSGSPTKPCAAGHGLDPSEALNGNEKSKSVPSTALSMLGYALRDKPHDDVSVRKKPAWPSEDKLEILRRLNMAPTCFVLEAGEYVHINKSRLHAFRKQTPNDADADEDICVSVAWDWIFQGVTKHGIEAEATVALESAKNNRNGKVPSLAITETAVIEAMRASSAVLSFSLDLNLQSRDN